VTYSTTQTSTLGSIITLAAEQQALWAKVGRGEKLTTAEQGRLVDIRGRLERLWNQRRLEKAHAKAHRPDSARAWRRDHNNRSGRAERRAAVSWSH
jgi:hypothetical protein